jgi:hypothetical protein
VHSAGAEEGGASLAGLLGARCRVRDVLVGEVSGVYVDAAGARVIGLDVRSAGDVHRFLPWVAFELDGDGVSVGSVFLLVDDGESYARLGARAITDAQELERLRVDGSGNVLDGQEPVSTGDISGIRSR